MKQHYTDDTVEAGRLNNSIDELGTVTSSAFLQQAVVSLYVLKCILF